MTVADGRSRLTDAQRTQAQRSTGSAEIATARPTQEKGGRTHVALRRMLVADGHEVETNGRTRCPSASHDDKNPSAHVFDGPDGGHVHCFACGYHIDAFTYLVDRRQMSRRQAMEALVPGGALAPARSRARQTPQEAVAECPTTPLPAHVVAAHHRRAERLERVPRALEGRGFTLSDLRRLLVVAEGERAVFPILGPDGQVLRLKVRHGPSEPGPRYRYLDQRGRGTPAWCSPGWGTSALTLVVEGELNAAICWCVRPDLDVVGVAGTSGSLPLTRLARRPVVLYADGDEAGRQALDRWARTLHLRGCPVSILPTWDRDACSVAGHFGRCELVRRLA